MLAVVPRNSGPIRYTGNVLEPPPLILKCVALSHVWKGSALD